MVVNGDVEMSLLLTLNSILLKLFSLIADDALARIILKMHGQLGWPELYQAK